MIRSEPHGIEQIYVTNQGTDAHLLAGRMGELYEGLSYRVQGIIADVPVTGIGGHVSFTIQELDHTVRCMAYEPTKNFRSIIRQLLPGDSVIAVGSFKKGSINLEKIRVLSLARTSITRPPLCTACNKRMTSDGKGKGWKCKKCNARAAEAEVQEISRPLEPGWYEVPPTARRHLAKPLCRGEPEF
jgi:tRNA(Ile2)-agmatinylcytidine synthase